MSQPKHDYRCLSCGDITPDYVGHLSSCLSCGADVETYYGNWTDVLMTNKGVSLNDRVDGQGRIQKFGVLDDPLCLMVAGLQDDKGGGFNSVLPEEHRQYYAEKILSGECGPTVRKEILKDYVKATGSSAEVSS
jgi:DNA-directed RNA polymerase subunit N (RpoN/RPB10)